MKIEIQIKESFMSNEILAIEHISDTLPLLPLKDIVIFPQMIIPVFISEDICLKAVEAACEKDRFVFMSAFCNENVTEEEEKSPQLSVTFPPPFDVYNTGVIASVLRMRKLPDGRTKILIQGLTRAVALNLIQSEPYPKVTVNAIVDKTPQFSSDQELLCHSVKEQLERVIQFNKSISSDILMLLNDVKEIGKLSDIIAGHLGLRMVEAQKILGTIDVFERLRGVQLILSKEIEKNLNPQKNQTNIREDSSKLHRENFLREQLKTLKQELGDMDSKDEMEEIREKILKANMNSDAKNESLKQLRRLERMNQDSSEASLTRTYLDWMTELPWSRSSPEKIDIHQCKKILDEDHFGLEKIKERVVEYLAVKKLNPNLKGPILCFVGPPGVGKTSLGKSIARALGKKYARISLGGVKDESEIRGHRRTYVGAMPGRILQALKNVGENNPVLMLDEIDKLGSDYKGDPSSALLEVLDPEQNNSFSDHYINVPFDLSKVVFIANANRLDTIPAPLRDRLEIIEISGYSEEEKSQITKQYIIPKVIEQNGLKHDDLFFQEATVSFVINSYTRESGLRSLEKNISTITRKIAKQCAENDEKGKDRKLVKVTTKLAKELLGEEKYLENDFDLKTKRVGVAMGLAYTTVGGEVLEIEVKLNQGNGKVTLTGQLGDVMKESAQTAISCLRGHATEVGIDPKLFEERDIHIHAPANGIPKDGPSAGITIFMALLSAFSNKPLRQNIAMTGEITLLGRILPIGGVREKCLAAMRIGIHKVVMPEKNRSSYYELPLNLRRKLEPIFISQVQDAVRVFFEEDACFENKGNALKGEVGVENSIQ